MPSWTAVSDEGLLDASVRERAAFGVFYERHERAVLGFFGAVTRRPEVAADLTAETFAAALDSVAQFDPSRGTGRMWLFGIARHLLARSASRGRVESEARRRIGLDTLVLRSHHIELIEALVAAEGDAIVKAWLRTARRSGRGAARAGAGRARVRGHRERPSVLGGGRAPAGQPRARPAAPAIERGRGMTILPELRDSLARSRPILPELRDGLVAARRGRHRRPALIAGLASGTLLATAGALAATGVIGLGSPVEPRQVNRDPQRGVGVPVDRTARLLPPRVADPGGGPPWGLRLVTTSRGMMCLQIGRVVGDQLGVLDKDGVAGNDGRFHALPPAAAATNRAPCVPPDGAGRFFTAVERTTYASGDSRDRTCHEPGEPARGAPPAQPETNARSPTGCSAPTRRASRSRTGPDSS
jgi:hypothetical protein